ncbi:MAG: cysteine desulfurase family protein [Patescibacteria group bacterium]
MQKKENIYLDYAATTPMDPLVLKAMEPYFISKFGNPNSPHLIGQEALRAVDQAREKIAQFINCATMEIVFTSGATESNNLAIRGVIKSYQRVIKNPEIIITEIEHPSVLNTCLDLEKQGIVVKYLRVNKEGIVDASSLNKLISDSTALVSVMYANNEIGTIQPVREIGKLISKLNRNRKYPIVFHTDAVQAAGTLHCDVQNLHVDLMSLSGHKLYGPKGVGALYVKHNTAITEMQTGGDQEYALRAGTLPVPMIVGMGKAVELCFLRQDKDRKYMAKLRDWTMRQLMIKLPALKITGALGDLRLANNMHLRMDGIDGNDIMFILDSESHIEVSTGSACSAGAPEPSKVLKAMGMNEKKSREGVRVSIGRLTTKVQLTKFVTAYTNAVEKLDKTTERDLR